jgi:hypothetical protein
MESDPGQKLVLEILSPKTKMMDIKLAETSEESFMVKNNSSLYIYPSVHLDADQSVRSIHSH